MWRREGDEDLKSVWCDPLNGAWPSWDKFRKYSITRIYVDARERILDGGSPTWRSRLPDLVDGIHSQGFEAGIYRDPVWGGWSTAQEYALLSSRDIRAAETGADGKVVSKQIAYMHDLETHDTNWILAALRQWRVYRPLRTTDVTWEPMQGGLWAAPDMWSTSVSVTELLDLLKPGGPGGVYHQNYYGGMQPAVAERVRGDLVNRGFPDARLFGFYDGKYLPAAWDGCVFTADRIAA